MRFVAGGLLLLVALSLVLAGMIAYVAVRKLTLAR